MKEKTGAGTTFSHKVTEFLASQGDGRMKRVQDGCNTGVKGLITYVRGRGRKQRSWLKVSWSAQGQGDHLGRLGGVGQTLLLTGEFCWGLRFRVKEKKKRLTTQCIRRKKRKAALNLNRGVPKNRGKESCPTPDPSQKKERLPDTRKGRGGSPSRARKRKNAHGDHTNERKSSAHL